MELNQALLILVIGMTILVVLFIAVVLISSITNYRQSAFKTYCDEQFEAVTKQINASIKNTEELTKMVKELNTTIKNK